MVDDKELLAAIVLSEASTEGDEGIQAVLNTIVNRSGSKNLQSFINSATEVNAYEGYTLREEKILSDYVSKYKDTDDENLKKQWKRTKDLIDKAVTGELADITGGATNYLNPDVQKAENRALPNWALWEETSRKKIGSHLFGTPLTADEVNAMEFGEAWKRGRSIMGEGSKFEWKERKQYTTD